MKRCLEAVAIQFSDESVKVDLTTFNAARIWKLYGTLAAKGDDIASRPHRLARLLDVPKKIRPMKRPASGTPRCYAADSPATGAHQGNGHGAFDLANWITEHELPVVADKDWKGGHIWILSPCPWNPQHTNRAAFIIRQASGAISAGCQHDGCRARAGTIFATSMNQAGDSGGGNHRGSRCRKAYRRRLPMRTGTVLPTGSTASEGQIHETEVKVTDDKCVGPQGGSQAERSGDVERSKRTAMPRRRRPR